MARYNIFLVRDLKRQLAFSPKKVLSAQLFRVEKLIQSLEPGKNYAFSRIYYAITKYSKKQDPEHADVFFETGVLRPDLRLLLAELASRHVTPVGEIPEQILQLAEVEKRFSISSRTLYRWRKRGLFARKYIFEDKSRRLGVLSSTLDHFVENNEDLVASAQTFSRISETDKDDIIRRSREFVLSRGWNLTRISAHLANEFTRSREAIRYTLRAHDENNPDTPIFGRSKRALSDEERRSICGEYLSERAIDELLRQYDSSRNGVYGVIKDIKSGDIALDVPEYVYNPIFDREDAESVIFYNLDKTPAKPDVRRLPGEKAENRACYKDLYKLPILTREEETDLFRRYNFSKYMIAKLKGSIASSTNGKKVLKKISRYEAIALATRNHIVEANLRLVISIARQNMRWDLPLEYLVSEGNMTLLRAVEKFDYSLGNRLNTYVTWAIVKDYAKHRSREWQKRQRYRAVDPGILDFMHQCDGTEEPESVLINAETEEMLAYMIRNLGEREAFVVRAHYGIDCRKQSLKEIGETFGVTKERVRQIKEHAIRKMRNEAEKKSRRLPVVRNEKMVWA
jgi:RNA polymerase primary sigma factor/RNA polymerase sigma factor